jgi:DNA-binding transcriptional LysR family regulator
MGFDWNRARAFLATAEQGSLSGAARVLGMTQPTLGRQVAALEEELGVTLFERAGRGLRLTAGGVDLLDHVRRMGEAAVKVSFSASGQSQTIEGPICITASEVISGFLLPPVLARLRREHPGVEIKLVASNTVRDLRRREADIAIRSGKPSDPLLIATRLRDTPARLYAARSYLQRIGNPGRAADFSHADFIGFSDDGGRFVNGLNALGFSLTPKNVALHTDNHMVLWELVKSGLGIGAIVEDVGDAEPLVARILPAMAALEVPAWLVVHREVHTSRRVRMVFDMLVEYFGASQRAVAPKPRPAKRVNPVSRRGAKTAKGGPAHTGSRARRVAPERS